jgi:tRNA pseudouridine55 synthase
MENLDPGEIEQAISAGVVLVDKPAGATSFDVVRQVRRLLGIKKVGHAGTLDPFATGLLILCAGRSATRHIDGFMSGSKEYQAVVQLGAETDTLDPEGELIRTAPVPLLSEEGLRSCLAAFTGGQQQVPPAYSAVKYKGKPLYHYARRGILVEKEARRIEIYSLRLDGFDQQAGRLRMTVRCSRGTYIRVLAADIGRKLGCGAHLVGLRRTASGNFSVADALPGGVLSEPDGGRLLRRAMMSVEEALAGLDTPDQPLDQPAPVHGEMNV